MRLRSAIEILRGTGPVEFVHVFSDTWRAKSLSHSFGNNLNKSSISDSGLYPSFCSLASSNDEVFDRFRRSLIYRLILEHVTLKQGYEYLNEIELQGIMKGLLPSLLESDVIGGPIKYQYGDHGLASPTTLRYIKVASDLEKLFGQLDGMRIAEIGVGYGGQCRVLCKNWNIGSYLIYDIPEVIQLSLRFLKESNVDISMIRAIDGRRPESNVSDIVLSNYAFSELQRSVQEEYCEQVIKHARRGYVTYNNLTPPEFESLTAEEFASRIPGAQIIPETPKTYEGNVVVVWGDIVGSAK